MTLPTVNQASYPTPRELHATLLAALRYAYDKAGLEANLKENSDLWIRSKVFSDRLAIALANNKISLADYSPLSAEGDALATLAGLYGVSKRPAAKASGFVTVSVSGSSVVTIPAGFVCVAPNGESYETITSNLAINGTAVEVQAVNAGAAGDQDTQTIMQWTDASIGALLQTCTVGSGTPISGDISGGADTDTDEQLRQRLLRRLASPSVGGNWAQVVQWAEESTSSVWQAFVYPAVRGPASYDVAIASSGDDRTLSTSIVAIVASYILANMPEHTDLNVTTVDPEGVDVVINLSLPLPVNAGGAGGGWRDGIQWPDSTNAADGRPARITGLSSGVITINSTSSNPPVIGRRFGIWDRINQEMREYTVMAVGGSGGAYTVTVDAGSPAITADDIGEYLSAGAFNLKTYASKFLAEMNKLGPGEKTASIDILPRGGRRPGPDVSDPSRLSSVQLTALTSAHPEILDISYGARLATETGNTLIAPTVASATSDPPKILHLRHLAFRKA